MLDNSLRQKREKRSRRKYTEVYSVRNYLHELYVSKRCFGKIEEHIFRSPEVHPQFWQFETLSSGQMSTLLISTMQEAIILNNHGVHNLKTGQFSAALKYLKQAAERLYKLTRETNQVPETEEEQAFEQNIFKLDAEGNCDVCCETSLKGGCSLMQSDNIGVFIQATPFCLPQTFPCNKVGLTFVSTIVLYNMGLTYHLSSCQCSSIPNAIESAVTLYKMSCALAVRHPGNDQLIPLVMACMNNLGCLYFDLGDFDMSKKFLDDLTLYIMSLGANLRVPQLKRNELMLNAILLRNPSAARAA